MYLYLQIYRGVWNYFKKYLSIKKVILLKISQELQFQIEMFLVIIKTFLVIINMKKTIR